MKQPLVSIVTVNYNNALITCALLESLRQCTYPEIEVIVVDNGSSESPETIEANYPEVQLIRSPRNLGFAGGNNLGFCHAQGAYLLMLNNDTEVDPGFLEPLVTVMERDRTIGCTTSKLVYFDSDDVLQYAGNQGLNPYTGRAFTRGYGETDHGQYDDELEVELAHGAAMMVRSQVWKQVGPLAEVYFLYYEEVDYCKRLRDAGYRIVYVGASRVWHKESRSVGKNSPLKTYYLTRNRLLYIRRNFSGTDKWLPLFFFLCLAYPKALVGALIRARWAHVRALSRALGWHLGSSSRIHHQPIPTP